MNSSAVSNGVSTTVFIMSVLTLGCFFEASCETVYTYTTKVNQSLPCIITEQTSSGTWSDIIVGNPPIRVLTYQRGSSPPVTKSTVEKYENFDDTLETTFFNLDILNVEEEDGGLYACAPIDGGGASYDVMVEVLAKPTIQYESQDVDVLNVIVGTSYDLTCSAAGARSNSDLSLMWEPLLVEKTPLVITPNGNYKDYSITSTYTAVRGDSTITCQLTGYVMQVEINDQRMEHISHTVNLNVQYAPDCSLVIQEGKDCRVVTLTCECDAVPADITQYSFFNESSLINDGPSKTLPVSVAYGTSTEFSCSATNDIGPGEKSDVKIHDCDIVISDCYNTGLIAACIVEAIVIVVFILVFIYLITRYRLGHGKKKEPRSTNQIDEIKGAGNRAYMDLQELEVHKNKKNKNLEVPEKNVKLVSLLPGKGMMQYHKALVMRAAGNLETVIRTLSGDSTLRMNELQSSEVQHILKLPGDNSIMKLLGWCDTVPNYLICEYLIGGTLSDHLTEEFSPQKVHQYGNTKQERFQVAEKGNAEHLPKYALQVARGLKFLTKHRFVSPGLRSKKVLLDAAGRCKLYDFVSMENAKEWTKLFLNENVPFQWMSPEFLFLETISPAGDVWSFGILLWEIFSYGSEPYKGQTRSDVEKSFRAKRQLPMPDNCPGAIWQVMITCWESAVEERLKIDDVTYKLAAMCHEDKEYQEIG